jgi:hypothetical protein
MPYMMDGMGVYKKNADGSKGELVKMHQSKEDAEAHMKALMANVKDDMMASLRTADVHELADLSEAVLFEDRKAAEVTLIKAGWSKNRRYYPGKVLEESAARWEGVKAYADHPTKDEQKARPERSVLDAAGVYENVRYQDGKVRATLRLIGEVGDRLWPWVVESVRGSAKPIGLSINALGQARKGEAEGQSGLIIEAITHANSVDIVTEPAAGGAFERLLASDDGWTVAVLAGMTLDELREARPDLLADLKREWKTTRDSQAIQDARAQAEQAEHKAQQLAEEHRTAQAGLAEAQQTIAALEKDLLVTRLLDNDRLPKETRGELREQLLKADGVEAMQALVEQALKLLGTVRLPVRVTGAGRPARPPEPSSAPARHPVAEVFGLSPELARAETLAEFQEAKQRTQGV